MRILLTGATGFMGRRIAAALGAAGHEVVGLARHPRESGAMAGDLARDLAPEIWLPRLEGIDAVVNAAGIIRERRGATFAQVHRDGPTALFQAAARAGVQRVVQISAIGARPDHPVSFLATKGQADEALGALPIASVVLRPSLVFGVDGESARLFRALAALPVLVLPGGGPFLSRPVPVDEVARAVVGAVEGSATGAFDVVGGECLDLGDQLRAWRTWLGERPGPVLTMPAALMELGARVGDLLGGRAPIDSARWQLLRHSAPGDPEPLAIAFGLRLQGLSQALARHPATEADRWHARLIPVRLPLRWLVASIWIATPLVSLIQWDLSLAMLSRSGFSVGREALLVAVCALELVGAALLLGGRLVRLVGSVQIAMMVFFTLSLGLTVPQMWLDPFGSLTKNLPLIGATMAMIALDGGRRR